MGNRNSFNYYLLSMHHDNKVNLHISINHVATWIINKERTIQDTKDKTKEDSELAALHGKSD